MIRWEQFPAHQEARKGGVLVGTVQLSSTSAGYAAYDVRGRLLGETATWQGARALVESEAADR